MKTFYMGNALKHAPASFKEFCVQTRGLIEQRCGLKALAYLGDQRPPGVSVAQYDLDLALRADYGVFIHDHASTGVGMEMMLRHCMGCSIIMFARNPEAESTIVYDFAHDNGYPYLRYHSAMHIAEQMKLWLDGKLIV